MIETHGFSAADPLAFNQAIHEELVSHGYAVSLLDRGRWIPVRQAEDIGHRAHLRAVLPGTTKTMF